MHHIHLLSWIPLDSESLAAYIGCIDEDAEDLRNAVALSPEAASGAVFDDHGWMVSGFDSTKKVQRFKVKVPRPGAQVPDKGPTD